MSIRQMDEVNGLEKFEIIQDLANIDFSIARLLISLSTGTIVVLVSFIRTKSLILRVSWGFLVSSILCGIIVLFFVREIVEKAGITAFGVKTCENEKSYFKLKKWCEFLEKD